MATVIQQQAPNQALLNALGQGASNFVGGRIKAGQQQRLEQQQQQQQQAQMQDLVALSQALQGGNTQQSLAGFQPQSPQGAQGLFNLTSQLAGSQGDPFTLSPGQQRFGAGGQQIASVAAPQAPVRGVSVSPGQQIIDPVTGRQIAAVPEKPKPRAGALQIARTGDESGLDAGTVFQADPQGNVKVISAPGGEALSKSDRSKIAITQAKEFRTDERIKNLQIVERSERGMAAALKQATSPNVKSRIASDQALGVLFQKMLDPTSVVRESEYARTPEGASAINRIIGTADQLTKGGLKLTNEDRSALAGMAQKLLDEAKITANKAFSEFTVRADELNLNKKIVFGGAKPFDIQAQVDQSQGATPPLPQLTQEQINAELQRRGVQ